MVNGHDKQVQINPQQAAAYALQFLEMVPHTRAQREQYDIATGMLQAIATGQVVLAPPPAPVMGQVGGEAERPQ
jgi:hypothetical protein